MLLFGRSRALNPARSRAAIAFAVEVAGRAREVTGHDVYAWSTVFSPAAGTLVWSARLDDMAQLEVAVDKLAVADDYLDFVEQGDSLFTGPTVDTLTQILHGTPDPTPLSYVQIVQAVCAPGKLSSAMAFGMEVADAVTRVTGSSCLFGSAVTGAWGAVSWISGSADAEAFQRANDTWYADPGTMPMLDRAGEFFQPAASSLVLRRLA